MAGHFLQRELPQEKGQNRARHWQKTGSMGRKFGANVSPMKTKNILLTVSLVAFAIGFSDLHENLLFWMGRPVGAILFGIYMIFLMLEDATANYNREEAEKSARIGHSAQPQKQKKTYTPVLKTAHSH